MPNVFQIKKTKVGQVHYLAKQTHLTQTFDSVGGKTDLEVLSEDIESSSTTSNPDDDVMEAVRLATRLTPERVPEVDLVGNDVSLL